MKGQYLTIEYTLFFAIGVAMVVIVYFIFSGIADTVRDQSTNYQIQRVGEYIRGSIINVFVAGNNSNSTINYKLIIPTTISGCVYSIDIKQYLFLNCTQNTSIGTSLSLYGINTSIENILYSSRGFVNIFYSRTGVVMLT